MRSGTGQAVNHWRSWTNLASRWCGWMASSRCNPELGRSSEWALVLGGESPKGGMMMAFGASSLVASPSGLLSTLVRERDLILLV